MKIPDLKLDRFLGKQASQSDNTKDAVYAGANQVPKVKDNTYRKIGQGNRGNEEDDGAPNVLTGTVITSCFIQTSALPSRIEMEGNNLTFYDDTYMKGGRVLGDTSLFIFTHDLNSGEGFIMEKRASIYETYDNILSWYATPAKDGMRNNMFIGRNGSLELFEETSHLSHISFHVNYDSGLISSDWRNNGVFNVSYSEDSVLASTRVLIAAGRSSELFQEPSLTGSSVFISGFDGGFIGIASSIIPLLPGSDLGDATNRFGVVYADSFNMGGLSWTSGAGSPEGSVVAPIGSLYSRTSGGALTTLYVKTSGSGNTGWTAK
jgi:hypothetical protein